MALSLNQQAQIVRRYKAAATLSDTAARELVVRAVENFLSGSRNSRQVRFDLEKIIRTAYRTSARAAMSAAREQAGKGKRWAPVSKDLTSETLDRLLQDVRRNLNEFKESDKGDTAYRRAVLRFQLSATVAAQKGFSDGQKISFDVLDQDGERVRKHWIANFDGHQPCDHCVSLHGLEVEAASEFPRPVGVSIYVDLYGPPLHPRCQCTALYVVSPDPSERLDVQEATKPTMIDSQTIKNLPLSIFKAVIGAVTRALDLLRKAVGL